MRKRSLGRRGSFRIKGKNRRLKKGRIPKVKILRTFVFIIFIIGIIFGIKGLERRFLNSLDFTIKNVRVIGDYPDIEEIKEEFKRYCIKEYKSQRPNIFEVNLDGLRRYLEALPKVSKVRIRRQFPETLFIEVKRRIPTAFILNNTNILGWDGHRAFKIDKPSMYDLPFITGVKKVQSKGVKEATRIILEIEKSVPSLLLRISEINASNFKELFAYTTDGVKIYFGNINNYDLKDKLLRLKEILDYTKMANLRPEYVDLRFNQIAIKPKG